MGVEPSGKWPRYATVATAISLLVTGLALVGRLRATPEQFAARAGEHVESAQELTTRAQWKGPGGTTLNLSGLPLPGRATVADQFKAAPTLEQIWTFARVQNNTANVAMTFQVRGDNSDWKTISGLQPGGSCTVWANSPRLVVRFCSQVGGTEQKDRAIVVQWINRCPTEGEMSAAPCNFFARVKGDAEDQIDLFYQQGTYLSL